MSVGVFSPVFPNAVPFLPAFFGGLRHQTHTDFVLWLALDRLSVSDVEGFVPPELQVKWVESREDDNPARLRKRAWSAMTAQHDKIVMIDSDDIAKPRRVETGVANLKDSDVNACALRIIDEHDRPVGAVLRKPVDGNLIRDVHHWNVFGLSNTAFRASALDRLLEFPDDLAIIDWHLFAKAVRLGLRLSYTSEPLMDYRQYSANTARILPPLDLPYVRRATGLVEGHLRGLLRTLPADAFANTVARRLEEVVDFGSAPDATLQAVLERLVPSAGDCYLWWEYVAPPDWRQHNVHS